MTYASRLQRPAAFAASSSSPAPALRSPAVRCVLTPCTTLSLFPKHWRGRHQPGAHACLRGKRKPPCSQTSSPSELSFVSFPRLRSTLAPHSRLRACLALPPASSGSPACSRTENSTQTGVREEIVEDAKTEASLSAYSAARYSLPHLSPCRGTPSCSFLADLPRHCGASFTTPRLFRRFFSDSSFVFPATASSLSSTLGVSSDVRFPAGLATCSPAWESLSLPSSQKLASRTLASHAQGPHGRREEESRDAEEKAESGEAGDSLPGEADRLPGEADRLGHGEREKTHRRTEGAETKPAGLRAAAEKRGKALQDFLVRKKDCAGEEQTQSASAPQSSEDTLQPSGEVTQIDVRNLPSSSPPAAEDRRGRLDAEEPAASLRVGRRRRGAAMAEREREVRKRPETDGEAGQRVAEATPYRLSDERAAEAQDAQPVLLRGDSSPASLSSNNLSSALSALPPRFPVLTALPLFRRPAFPGFFQLLHIPDNDVFEALVRQKKSGVPGGDYVAGFLTIEEKEKEHEVDEEGPGAKLRKDAGRVLDISELHSTGSLLHLLNFAPHSSVKGGQVVVMPYRRIRLLGTADSPSSSPVSESQPLSPASTDTAAPSSSSSSSRSSLSSLSSPSASGVESFGDNDDGFEGRDRDNRDEPKEAFRTSEALERDQLSPASSRSPDPPAEGDDQSPTGVSVAAEKGTEGSQPSSPSAASSTDADPDGQAQRRGEAIQPESPSSLSPVLSPVAAVPSAPTTFSLLRVRIAYLPDESGKFDVNDTQKALHLEIIATMKELLKQSYFYKEHFDQVVRFYNLDSPHKLADLVAGMSFAKRQELQAVLAEEDIEKRLRLVLEIAKKDLEFSKLQAQVKAQVEEKMNKMQRKFLLTEQLKFLKRELGDVKDDKESILDSFSERLEKKKRVMPAEVQKAVAYELSKLSSLEQSSSEFNITRTYTDCLLSLPWGEYTEECSDIFSAEKVLNEDHYGLSDVKDRILEFIAVTILKKDVQGKIICLVGPPGVGKTSVGQSIARALRRKFYRISLGGMCDVAELRGHRRTYISALPGKVIQALKECQTMNPVILLDEIDKLGRDFRGDPSSALLEILDPSQNKSFRDYYLDIPVDLSKVLFVCTANTPDVIPGPLLDRMEVIRIAGYIFQEKLCIARNYLLPQTSQSTGLSEDQIHISADVLEKLVRDYAREAGVRSLLKLIEKIYRKAALALVRKEQEKIEVHLDNLSKFVGQPAFQSDRLYAETPPGVVMGLAWTQLGGATLYVEAIGRRLRETSRSATEKRKGREEDNPSRRETGDRGGRRKPRSPAGAEGRLKVTGQLGNVMSESSEIALTFCRMFVRCIEPSNSYLETAQIHLHVPEGATPKDGPSAGITMATALVSLALNRPVLPDVAMTGELTLTGKVLKIGGVKEKVIAARRENVNTLIFPKANEREFDELPEDVREGLSVHFASTYDDVYRVAFGAEPPRRAENDGVHGGLA